MTTRQAIERRILETPRPYRLMTLMNSLTEDTLDKDFWHLLRLVWTDCEGPSLNKRMWLIYFESQRKNRESMFTPAERKQLDSLPDEFPIYRGYSGPRGKSGLSWTLDKAKAEWFAHRFGFDNDAKVVSGLLKKTDVLGLFQDRKESEIVTNPKNVRSQNVEKLSPTFDDDDAEEQTIGTKTKQKTGVRNKRT